MTGHRASSQLIEAGWSEDSGGGLRGPALSCQAAALAQTQALRSARPFVAALVVGMLASILELQLQTLELAPWTPQGQYPLGPGTHTRTLTVDGRSRSYLDKNNFMLALTTVEADTGVKMERSEER